MSSQLQTTTQLIQRLARLYPHYGQTELLRMALLISLHSLSPQAPSGQVNSAGDSAGGSASQWDDAAAAASQPSADADLLQHSLEISLQLNAVGDQHAALAEELDSLAAVSPCEFSPEHLFALVRAIRIQSRMLNMYLGPQLTAAF